MDAIKDPRNELMNAEDRIYDQDCNIKELEQRLENLQEELNESKMLSGYPREEFLWLMKESPHYFWEVGHSEGRRYDYHLYLHKYSLLGLKMERKHAYKIVLYEKEIPVYDPKGILEQKFKEMTNGDRIEAEGRGSGNQEQGI